MAFLSFAPDRITRQIIRVEIQTGPGSVIVRTRPLGRGFPVTIRFTVNGMFEILSAIALALRLPEDKNESENYSSAKIAAKVQPGPRGEIADAKVVVYRRNGRQRMLLELSDAEEPAFCGANIFYFPPAFLDALAASPTQFELARDIFKRQGATNIGELYEQARIALGEKSSHDTVDSEDV